MTPDAKVAVTLLDIADGGASIDQDSRLILQRWFIARQGFNAAPTLAEAPDGTYRLAEQTRDAYVYRKE